MSLSEIVSFTFKFSFVFALFGAWRWYLRQLAL